MKRVFIAGATGYLGRYLVNEFGAQGWEVHALCRNTKRAVRSGLIADKMVQGQGTEPKDLQGKMGGVDLVISTLGITRQKDGMTYQDVDYQANINLLREAEYAGVKRFCYIHVLNAHKMKHVALIAAKQAFVDELQASPIASTIISPSGYFSDMGDFINMAKSGRIYLFGDGEKRLNPIHGADLATSIHYAVTNELADLQIGGPETFTQNDMARLAFEATGKPIKIIHLPVSLVTIALFFLKTFTSQSFYGPYQFFLAALRLDMVAQEHGNRRLSHLRRRHLVPNRFIT
ncbi:MAG: SDR family oxidoreductase [Hyphomicrobiales bacterium]